MIKHTQEKKNESFTSKSTENVNFGYCCCVPWNALNFAALIIRKHGSFEQIEQLTHLHLKFIEECIECLDPSRQLNRNSHAFLELSIVRSGCIKNNVTQLKSSYHNDEPNEKSSFPSTAMNQNAFFHSTND